MTVNFGARFRLVDGRIQDARVAIGCVADRTLRLTAAETALNGKLYNEATMLKVGAVIRKNIKPISDQRGTAEDRLTLAGNFPLLMFRELEQAV